MHLIVERANPTGVIRQIGRIVETEAYQGPEDLAAHSRGGLRTPRTESMFGPGGHAYVYLIYGMHHCLNVVTAAPGVPHAVLIRAIEPIAGIDGPTHGPGRLCRTLGIDRSSDGVCLLTGPIALERPRLEPHRMVVPVAGPRIGVSYAGEWANRPWRFVDPTSRYLSIPLGSRSR